MKKISSLIIPFIVVLLFGGKDALLNFCNSLYGLFKAFAPFIWDYVSSNIWTSPQFWMSIIFLAGSICSIYFGKRISKIIFSIVALVCLLLSMASIGMYN